MQRVLLCAGVLYVPNKDGCQGRRRDESCTNNEGPKFAGARARNGADVAQEMTYWSQVV